MDHQLYLQVSSETRKRFDPQYLPGINTQPYLRVPSETWEKHYHHMSLSQTVDVWQKMVYFCDKIGVFTPPTLNICRRWLIWALWDTEKKLTSIWNFRVKRLIFSQKTVDLVPIWGCFTPPRTLNTCQGWLKWIPNPTYESPLRHVKKKLTSIWNFRVKRSIFVQKWSFFAYVGVFYTPGTLNIWRGWLIPTSNPTYKSPLRHGKIKLTSLWNYRVKWSIFSKEMDIFVTKLGCFTHPGPPMFAGDGSYGPQILPTSAFWDTWKRIDLHLKF